MSPRLHRTLLRLAPFPVVFFLLAQVFLISDWAAVGGNDGLANVPDSAITLDLRVYLFASFAVGCVGLLVGSVELLFLNERLSRRSLGQKLILKSLFYAVLLLGVMLVAFPLAAMLEMGVGPSDAEVWRRLSAFLRSPAGIGTGVQLSTSVVASIFYSEMSEHLGPRTLFSFISGRYHTPKQEERVFLFSDMKRSTTIAERLGHVRYFDFLRAYYDAFSDAIVDHGGEVYQYVGDEVVVSWPAQRGLRDGACLRCVFDMKRLLRARAADFQSRFGEVPDFKAGLQIGPVTTGEIGELKKDIVFTGDVLNQSARLQSLAGDTGHDVVIGDDLRSRLPTRSGEWRFQSLGEHRLRGKEVDVEAWVVCTSTNPATADASESGPTVGSARRTQP